MKALLGLKGCRMKREFLQLAHTFNPKKHGVAGWFLSEKLDGMRCLWDGGLSRGRAAADVPWANVEKHARYKTEQIASGLWTRYGQPIHAPDWFLDDLPPIILDGELYAGRGQFQHVVSTVKRLSPVDSQWDHITYKVFDAPRADEVFADGTINNTNFKKVFRGIRTAQLKQPSSPSGFAYRLSWLRMLDVGKCWSRVEQVQLPFKTADALAAVERGLNLITGDLFGGEGLILKSPNCMWLPERCHTMLKYKKTLDAEGTVIGYTWGRETDKGSKLLGLMGALIVRQDNGKTLELSGFTDEERNMEFDANTEDYGSLHPGEVCEDFVYNPKFPRGSRVTYRYRELTDDGVAKEGRYFRRKIDE